MNLEKSIIDPDDILDPELLSTNKGIKKRQSEIKKLIKDGIISEEQFWVARAIDISSREIIEETVAVLDAVDRVMYGVISQINMRQSIIEARRSIIQNIEYNEENI